MCLVLSVVYAAAGAVLLRVFVGIVYSTIGLFLVRLFEFEGRRGASLELA